MGERTEEPTAKKRADARQRGQAAKSQDLSAVIIMAGVTAMLFLFGPYAFRSLLRITRHSLGPDGLEQATSLDEFIGTLSKVGAEVALAVVPSFIVMFLVAAIAQVVQVGLMFSTKAIEPSLSKINPVKGLQKLFSKRSVVRGTLDLLKFAALVAAVYVAMIGYNDDISALPLLTIMGAVEKIAEIILVVALHILAVLLLIGLLDFTYQKWQTTQDLKMTKHEVKDERKSMEGNPEVRAKRAKLARQQAIQRVQNDVPQADVVVTNPTHVSVALKYDAGEMSAPRVIAKGADYLALRIRQVAASAGVPIVERPPLARALYGRCEVGDEVPEREYEAVAEVLAYVYQLAGRTSPVGAGEAAA
jgi:flagellar biosynthetic protein FlhB